MDREKVIKGLESLHTRLLDVAMQDSVVMLDVSMVANAIAMLKDKETVEPTLIHEGRNKYYNNYVCPRCDNEVIYEQNYCSECGVKFMWEGR